jgi:tetratricopeptide (TPR) repeat protein
VLRSLLAIIALLAAAPAQAEWWEARTDHFIVYSESSAADAKVFAERLERFDGALRSLQNSKFAPVNSDAQRLTVYRFGDIDDIGRLAGGGGVAGFYIPRLGGSVAFSPAKSGLRERSLIRRDRRTNLDPQSVLFHEYAHHFMFQHFPAAYPTWYIEGFAETAATIEFRPDGSFHLGNPPQYRSDMLLSGMLPVTATSMLTSTDKPDFFDVFGNYTVGWLLNHYLTFEPSRQGQLTKYLRLINDGTDPSAAARQAFGDLRQLDRDLARYKTSGRLLGADVRPGNYVVPKVTMRKLDADEEAIMWVRIRSKRGVSRKTSPDVARDARAIAQKYPQSFAVQLALAEAELDTKSYAAAEAAVDRALALNPNSVEAMLIKGQVYLDRGKQDKALLPTARPWFAKAYKADPQHPAPLVYNYLTYFHQGGQIPESALIGLERAYDLALYDASLRLILARQLIAEKKGPLARQVLRPLALSPHESKRAKAMHEVVALIDANRLDEAYSKLASEMKRIEDDAEKGS